jgi:hypothetical protein
MKSTPGGDFLFVTQLQDIMQPVGIGGWMQLSGVVVFGLAAGLVTAALSAARRGGDASGEPVGRSPTAPKTVCKR